VAIPAAWIDTWDLGCPGGQNGQADIRPWWHPCYSRFAACRVEALAEIARRRRGRPSRMMAFEEPFGLAVSAVPAGWVVGRR
jgi:hypothetical protein